MDHTICAHSTTNTYAFPPTCHTTIPCMLFHQLMKHQLMGRISDTKQKTTCPFPVSMRDVVKNTGSENWTGSSHLYPSLSVQLSSEVSEIQSSIQCTLKVHSRHVVFVIILEINWAGIIIPIPNMRKWSNWSQVSNGSSPQLSGYQLSCYFHSWYNSHAA